MKIVFAANIPPINFQQAMAGSSILHMVKSVLKVLHVQLPVSVNKRLIDNSGYASPGYDKTFPEEAPVCRSMAF